MSLDHALAMRRSVRKFQNHPLSLKQISQLLWAAQGITDKRGFRTAPSAGALYPLEIYVVKRDGVWRFNPHTQTLSEINDKDLRAPLAEAAYDQTFVARTPFDLVITGIAKRTTRKYGPRGVNYMYAEAGHAAQNYLLEATALHLGAVPIGGFKPYEVQKILKLPSQEEPIYIIPTGKIK